MKIVSYNLSFLFDSGNHMHSGKEYYFSPEFIESRVEYFSKEFSKINADIVFVCEVGSEDVLKKIIEKSSIPYNYFIANPDSNGVGNAILYKDQGIFCESIPPVASSMPVFVTGDIDTIGPRIWPRRDFIHIKTEYNGKLLHILGVHLKSTFLMPEKSVEGADIVIDNQIKAVDGLIRSEMFHYSQAKKAREIIDTFFNEDAGAQVVVVGDFNTPAFGKSIRMIRGDIKKQSDSLLQVLNKVPKERQFSILMDADNGVLLDHVLISKQLELSIKNVEILNYNLFSQKDNPNFPFIVESDHAPVVLELG